MAQAGRVRIIVTDTTGAVIPTAQASLLGPENRPMRTEQANERGEILFGDLPLGNCRFAVFTRGSLATQQLTTIIRNADEVRLETALQLGIMGEVVTVTVEQMPLPSKLGSTLPPPSPTSKPKRWWWQIFH
jgi:hypothetical protein